MSTRSRSRSARPRPAPGAPRRTYAITGAGWGIGLELARQLAGRGDKVFALVQAAATPEVAAVEGDVTVVEHVDVSCDGVGARVVEALGGARVDCLVNNAGVFGGPRAWEVPEDMWATQSLEAITPEKMLDAFEVNTLGPLKVTKALLPQLAAPGGRVAVISSLMGSLGDNSSGGQYAYRASKAALNMVGRTLAMDLKKRGIAVALIHPGMVATSFAGDVSKLPAEQRAVWRDVSTVVGGVVEAIDAMTLEGTGEFVHGNYGQGLRSCPW